MIGIPFRQGDRARVMELGADSSVQYLGFSIGDEVVVTRDEGMRSGGVREWRRASIVEVKNSGGYITNLFWWKLEPIVEEGLIKDILDYCRRELC